MISIDDYSEFALSAVPHIEALKALMQKYMPEKDMHLIIDDKGIYNLWQTDKDGHADQLNIVYTAYRDRTEVWERHDNGELMEYDINYFKNNLKGDRSSGNEFIRDKQ